MSLSRTRSRPSSTHQSCAQRRRDAIGVRLRVCAKLHAERFFKFKLTKQRFDSARELRVVSDGMCEVLAPYFLCFLRAERSHQKVSPVVHRARTHALIYLEVGNKSSYLVAGQLAEPRSTRKLEQRVGVFVIPVVGERSRLRFGWRRELSVDHEQRSELRDERRCDLRKMSAHTERRSELRQVCAHTKRRSGLRRVSAHTERRSGFRLVNVHTERRSGVRRVSA